jgi:hypothetical protein
LTVLFDGKVLKVEVKEKQIKHPQSKEAPAYYEVVREGKLTVEFDGDAVNVQELSDFIGIGVPSTVALARTSHQLPGNLQA